MYVCMYVCKPICTCMRTRYIEYVHTSECACTPCSHGHAHITKDTHTHTHTHTHTQSNTFSSCFFILSHLSVRACMPSLHVSHSPRSFKLSASSFAILFAVNARAFDSSLILKRAHASQYACAFTGLSSLSFGAVSVHRTLLMAVYK